MKKNLIEINIKMTVNGNYVVEVYGDTVNLSGLGTSGLYSFSTLQAVLELVARLYPE